MYRVFFRSMIPFFLIFLLLPVFLAAEGQREMVVSGFPDSTDHALSQDSFPRTVEDGLGRTLTLQSPPQRIISGTLMTDEILLSLVESERIISVTNFATDPAVSNISDRLDPIPRRSEVNVELYVSLSPDLVFLADWSDASVVRQLQDAGIAVYQVKTPLDLNAVKTSISGVAAAVGEDDEGRKLITWIDDKLSVISESIEALEPQERVSVMDYSTWGSAMGKGSSWDYIVNAAGCINAVGDLVSGDWGAVPVSRELLITLDPDVLVLPGWVYGDPEGAEEFRRSVLEDPALAGLSAVRSGQVIQIPESYRSSTSQYMVLAVEALAKAAYPGLLP